MSDIVSRPVLIDEQDGPCEFCSSWAAGKVREPRAEGGPATYRCDGCGGDIPDLKHMWGRGYESPRPHHYHIRRVGDLNGRQAVKRELCPECFRADFRLAYPGQEPRV